MMNIDEEMIVMKKASKRCLFSVEVSILSTSRPSGSQCHTFDGDNQDSAICPDKKMRDSTNHAVDWKMKKVVVGDILSNTMHGKVK